MTRTLLAAGLTGLLFAAGRPPEMTFSKHTLDLGANETCAFADINRDGKLDIVSGENWFAAPRWEKHRFRELFYSNNYLDTFSDLPIDVNDDKLTDIVSCSWFSKKLVWHQNPGAGDVMWKEHSIEAGSPVEFAFLVDIDNDGKAQEVLPQFGQEKTPLAWYGIKDGAWVRHVVSQKSYGHGIGAGDVNGDGRTDILTPKGWFEAPADPKQGDWKMHSGLAEAHALGFMHVMDVNGDGRNDIVTSHAHDYGIVWLEQGEGEKWTKRIIDDSWSGGHALSLVDLNGDGRKDILTGKRYMAHNGKDPGEREPLGIYWYESIKGDDGKLEWAKHVLDYGSRTGGGMQLPVADLDGDGDLDFAAPGKSGLFLFLNEAKAKRVGAKTQPSQGGR